MQLIAKRGAKQYLMRPFALPCHSSSNAIASAIELDVCSCGSRNRRRRVRGLHGPDTLPQPINQREIISSAAKDRLAKMNVRLHKTGNHDTAAGIDHDVRGLSAAADFGDASVIDEEVGTLDGVVLVHRHECSVFDED